ncbi:hypothetical protein [Chitinophaga pinensis]|uniref:Lipoprotein n=1 Tax=Chitinophaga pinensis (strain ATCC 43595 / DSM 2588 / LMG 13176 / NBRC 15968 / NCIMB 11800 / UQM 2034) TaxID=485918 RepID=A0A979GYH0_CHIPD|nr:hypothetical protein [Chitinophaga pinensis]ACU63126.1 hypothetical protein Cpin_5704 [Chitinophaga pinensis DSM 2588]
MTTKLFLSVLLVLVFVSCNSHGVQHKPQNETPKALENKNTYEFVSKRGYDDILETLYQELVSKDPKLEELEMKIGELNSSQDDSTESFDRFNGKVQSYFLAADKQISAISDSLLRERMKLLMISNQTKYNAQTAPHNELLKAIEKNKVVISDLHNVLKIIKTLPLIEKYQKDNVPSTKSIEGFIKQQDRAGSLLDTLVHK